MDFGSKGWGKVILTSVEFPSWTCYALYAHLSCVYVQPGQKLSSNVMVGLTGISGNSSVAYPHLHFEIWKSRDAGKAGTRELYRVDPLHVLGPIPFKNLASDILERKSKRQNTVNLNVIGGIPV
ncbi:Murein DD-endopeptidase MepM [compost metagenome]